MIVCDTSGILAGLDESHPFQTRIGEAVQADPGPLLLSPFVLAELDYLLRTRVGVSAETQLLREVAAGIYRLEPFEPAELADAIELINRYEDLSIGLADASIVILARKYRTERVLTLDERHFRTLRPSKGKVFQLLPFDF